MNSPHQHPRKCIKNGIENMDTDVRFKGLKQVDKVKLIELLIYWETPFTAWHSDKIIFLFLESSHKYENWYLFLLESNDNMPKQFGLEITKSFVKRHFTHIADGVLFFL